jgi:hypothetical protein
MARRQPSKSQLTWFPLFYFSEYLFVLVYLHWRVGWAIECQITIMAYSTQVDTAQSILSFDGGHSHV